jgi:uncharacterized membrane protein SpoIIM required for sporulation
MSAALLLLSTFALVFALGMQSQLVNNGHFVGAFFNSLAIGSANLVLFKLAPTASGIEVAAYLIGGPFGIVCSMATYRWMRTHKTIFSTTTGDSNV